VVVVVEAQDSHGVAATTGGNSKFQTTNSKQIQSTKFQTSKGASRVLDFGNWATAIV
jgi:hypothetical protein